MSKQFITTKTFGQHGRCGYFDTRAGRVLTPTFMPDGTRGVVKTLTAEQVAGTGVQVVLANTYHLHLQPGEAVVASLGGLHEFGKWRGPILTDSGGFQVFSLGKHTKVTEEGVTFKDPVTGSKHLITPESSMQIQFALGSDMFVAFDHLIGLDDATPAEVKEAFDRTHRWLERCVVEFKKLTKEQEKKEKLQRPSHGDAVADFAASNGEKRTEVYADASSRSGKSANAPQPISIVLSSADEQANGLRRPLLFGVVQGGLDLELRSQSLKMVQDSDVDGIAIGGLSVGEPQAEMFKVLEHLAPQYDADRPRFLLGVGAPADLRFAYEHGIDMADCVLPTRNARHATVWVSGDKKIHLTNEQYTQDASVIDPGCDCYTCASGYSKGFFRHQFKVREPLAGSLASVHNLRYLTKICEELRR
ncbi:tRNA-guanine transglycosylase [Candidatus Saccharibacteria bacterium]|nr:MAG: tRNA-guanine transglycosylase [Candidatus Saccharibacteria bacterium]